MPPDDDQHSAVDAVEALAGMASMGPLIAAFHASLREGGFDEAEALSITRAYVHGLAGGKLS